MQEDVCNFSFLDFPSQYPLIQCVSKKLRTTKTCYFKMRLNVTKLRLLSIISNGSNKTAISISLSTSTFIVFSAELGFETY